MARSLLICALVVCGASAISVQNPPFRQRHCGQYDEVLKNCNGSLLGSSLHLGMNDDEQRVSWETASLRIITPPYLRKSMDYTKDSMNPAGPIGHPYGLETEAELDNAFESVDVGGCSVHDAQVGEMKTGSLLGGATIIGGLRPIPGKVSHPLLGGRAPRVSFCFPRDPSMDARLTLGASDPRSDSAHLTLKVAGGEKAHHWAVNVTGMSMQGRDASGEEWSRPILEEARQSVVDDKKAYWIAVFSTGSQTLTAPKEVLMEMRGHLNEKNLVDQADTSRLPSLRYQLDNQVYILPAEAYLRCHKQETSQKDLHEVPLHFRPKLGADEMIPQGSCVMMFAPPTPFPGVFVLGQPFLRYHTTTYDFEHRQIVTAPHDGSCFSGATRSPAMFSYLFSIFAIAISLGNML